MSSVAIPSPRQIARTDPLVKTGNDAAAAALVLQIAGRPGPSFVLDSSRTNTIGRSADAFIVLPDRLASRNHAEVFFDRKSGSWMVRDLGSRNGTWVDGESIHDACTLQNGSVLRVGTSELALQHLTTSSIDPPSAPGRFLRYGPVSQLEGTALRRSASGTAEEARRSLLLYQASLRLLASRSIEEVIRSVVELAAEHSGCAAVGWFERRTDEQLAPICTLPSQGRLASLVHETIAGLSTRDGNAVWITAPEGSSANAAGMSGDLVCVPIMATDAPRAAICGTAASGVLKPADFDFLIALASLASAARAGHGLEAMPGIDLASLQTVDIDQRQAASLVNGRSEPDEEKLSQVLEEAGRDEGISLRMEDWHRVLVREALRRASGNVPEAAAALGISRATLYRKLDAYGLTKEGVARNGMPAESPDHEPPLTPPPR